MVLINIYILTDDECQAVMAENKKHNKIQMIVCDYGLGCGIIAEDIVLPVFSDWYNILNSMNPFVNRVITEVDLPDDD